MADAVKIEGLDDVLDAISDMADEQELRRALGKACALVEREAKQRAKKGETGDLAKFIQYEVEKNGVALVGVVFSPLEYAPYVEYGTGMYAEKGGRSGWWVYVKDSAGGISNSSKGRGKTYTFEEAKRAMAILCAKGLDAHITCGRHPQPFLRPALHENRENILRILKGGLKGD